jgi:hypothetical protein
MQKFITLLGILLIAISMDFVTAWGFQVFWNHLVLNIWQLFTTVDVVNTMQISYWVFFAIAISIGLVYNPPAKESESTDNIAEAFAMVIGKIATKLITIGLVLLVTSLVF